MTMIIESARYPENPGLTAAPHSAQAGIQFVPHRLAIIAPKQLFVLLRMRTYLYHQHMTLNTLGSDRLPFHFDSIGHMSERG